MAWAGKARGIDAGMFRQLGDLARDWQLTRAISDHLADKEGQFTGTARFTPEPGGLAYRETGTLIYGGQPPLTATRQYHWRAEGDQIVVLFADRTAFHSFCPNAPTARHFCAPDHYDVAYDFAEWPNWTARWQVRGPRKDYVSITRYRPSGSSPT